MNNPSGMNWLKLTVWDSESGEPVILSLFRPIMRNSGFIFLAIAALLLIYGRWQSIIFPLAMNPDEAQFAANALRIREHGFDWNGLDGSTAGPLDSLVLYWPYMFGLAVTFATARLTACLVLLLTCAATYSSMKALSGKLFATLLTIPLVLFYAFTEDSNFVHYSSELLPLLLLVTADCIAIRISSDQGAAHEIRFLLLGLLLGATPFAKLQALPIATAIGLYTVFLAARSPLKYRLRNAVALVVGGLVPAGVLLLPLLVSGHWQDFWNSYIAWAFLYIQDPLSFMAIHWMLAKDLVVRYVFYFACSVGLASLIHSSLWASKQGADPRARAYSVIYSSLLLIVVFLVISRPGNLFPHYLMFVPPFLLIFCACIAGVFVGHRSQTLIFVLYYAVFSMLFLALYASNDWNPRTLRSYRSRYETRIPQQFMARSPELLSWLPIPAKHLLVWGWMPQWYVWSGLTPATRETQIYTQVKDTELRDYFRARFMSDLEASAPEIIIDAVAGRSFYFDDPSRYSPDTFQPFGAFLAHDYSLVPAMKPDPSCPKLYVENQYRKLVDARLIVPVAVTATSTYGGDDSAFNSSKLFDNSVTEDTCVDFWLLPQGTLGAVDMKFSAAERVSKVMILNTENGSYLDRATKRAEVALLASGQVVEDRKIAMRPYPYWTEIDFDKPVRADHLDVKVLSYYGHGGGLNEIKIFRADDGNGSAP